MLVKYRLLTDPEDADWKEYDTVEVLKLNYSVIQKSQEEFDNMELSRFQRYNNAGYLEYEVVE